VSCGGGPAGSVPEAGRQGAAGGGAEELHDLRHTCASLLAAADANPKAVQVHLGHSSIAATMDRYTHLFPSDVEALVRRLEDIRARSLAAQPRPRDRSRGIELGGR